MSARGIFTKDDGRPVVFFLHKSIRGDMRVILREEIQKHGGQVTDDDDEAETVLIDDYALHPTVLQLRYAMRPGNPRVHDFWVEPLTFVRKCVNWGFYSHESRKVGMPGRAGNEEGLFRVAFTPSDDDHLVRFLATHLPDKSAGGRLGQEPYKRLVSLYDENDPDTYAFKWVRRHTYQSWQERYKKNQARLDPLIDAIALREDPPDAVTYERHRMYKRGIPKHAYVQEEEEEVEEQIEESPQHGQEEQLEEDREPSPTQVEYQPTPEKTMKDGEVEEEYELEEAQDEQDQIAAQVAGQKRRHSDGDALVAQRVRWDKRPRLASSQNKGKQRVTEHDEEIPEELRPFSPTLVDRTSQIYPPLPENSAPLTSPRASASTGRVPGHFTPESSHTRPSDSRQRNVQTQRRLSHPQTSPYPAGPSQPRDPIIVAPQRRSAAQTRVRRRAAPAPVVPADAPARNTRGRSREPSAEPVPPLPTRRRQGRRRIPSSPQSEDSDDHLGALQEEDENDENQPPAVAQVETLEDEEAVEQQLMHASALSMGGIGGAHDDNEEPRYDEEQQFENEEGSEQDEESDTGVRGRGNASDDDLSSDDAQTREHISFRMPASPISAPPAISTEILIPKVPPQVRRLARGTQPASQSLPLPHTPANGRTARSSRTAWPAADLLSLSMRQRSPQGQRAMSSESSSEEYPLPNTRASAVKRRLLQEQMQSPYVPAQGTRASQILRARALAS
ncbi:hypothetical protein HDZ31DRAFT_62311 [Schizophyllum fasciatum]